MEALGRGFMNSGGKRLRNVLIGAAVVAALISGYLAVMYLLDLSPMLNFAVVDKYPHHLLADPCDAYRLGRCHLQ